MKTWLRRAAAFVALSYVASVVIALVLLRFVGEHHWATSVALYLPRFVLFLPLPVTSLALWFLGPRRLLSTQALAGLIVLFPLMGFVVPTPFGGPHAGRPSFRVLSFNVDSLNYGPDRVADAIDAEKPDLVLLQEFAAVSAPFLDRLRHTYGNVQTSTQFVIATRFPITETTEPDKLPCYGRRRSPRFIRYVVTTPLGPIAVYSVHPVSPRFGFYALRGQGLRKEILSGRLFGAARSGPMREDTGLRVLQAQTFSERARAETVPVLIAGDTNLPGLSPTLAANLSSFRDAFAKVGSGFGYTYPARHAWMRIDRLLSSSALTFTTFKVSCRETSDHLCIVADVERAD